MSEVAVLEQDFSLKLPRKLCEAQNWKEGQRFALIPKGSGILLAPVPTLAELRGIAPHANPRGYRDRNNTDQRE